MSAGRPIEWTQEKKDKAIDLVLHLISIQGLSLNKIFSDDNLDLPNKSTFYEWLLDDKELSNKYVRACEMRSDILFDEMIEIADTPIDGIVIETDDNGRTKERKGDMLGHRRLQVDTRKWILSKMNPKKYGDKTDITTNGEKVTNIPIIEWVKSKTE